MGISIKQKGDFTKTFNFFKNSIKEINDTINLEKYGMMGVKALKDATPKDSGETASHWSYKIVKNDTSIRIQFLNSNVVDGIPVAILLQYGHGTRNGGYVEGYDFINPALRPIFDRIAEDAWKEVTKV